MVATETNIYESSCKQYKSNERRSTWKKNTCHLTFESNLLSNVIFFEKYVYLCFIFLIIILVN